MDTLEFPEGFNDMTLFPLIDALQGRRSRRYALGVSIPDGPLPFISNHPPMPLNELEKILVLVAASGTTGWHDLTTYAATANGRTFPSAAGLHTSEIFFTNDDGVFLFSTRDMPVLSNSDDSGKRNLKDLLDDHRVRIRKIADKRLNIPPREPYMMGHNIYFSNCPGSLLIIPVADVAQHMLGILCLLVKNGYCIYDDIHQKTIPGIEKFRHKVDIEHPIPLSILEQDAIAEVSVEMSTGCYAGMLMLQAIGLGGWMYSGIDRLTILGASGAPNIPGLGFRFDTDERWSAPNPTGLTGIFEAYCPPHYANMYAAVEGFTNRQFGLGGPFNVETPGPWKNTAKVRGHEQLYSHEFKECVSQMAQFVFESFGKFPGTVPSIYTSTYLQAHHLDLDAYDRHYETGAYLPTHAQHMAKWHK